MSPPVVKRLFPTLPIVLVGVLFGLACDAVHGSLTRRVGERSADSPFVPDGKSLPHFTLGQDTTVADVLFLELVQYLGTAAARGAPGLYPLADAVTDVDPLFGWAYEVGGIALTDPCNRIEESNRLLEKGMRNVPDRWQLAFFAAFNRWYGMGDYGGAAPLLLEASRLPGSPSYLPDLAARLFTEVGDLETGLRLIDATLSQQLTDGARGNLESRRRDLLIERELRKIDEAAARFAARTGRRPENLAELRASDALPLPPFEVAYDKAAGEATSPLLPKRIRLYHPDAKPAPLVTETSP